MNGDIQTNTIWSIRNKADQNIDDTFNVSEAHRLANSDTYGSNLTIPDCSRKDLDGVMIYCGSHADRTQVLFEFKICGKCFNTMLCIYVTIIIFHFRNAKNCKE